MTHIGGQSSVLKDFTIFLSVNLTDCYAFGRLFDLDTIEIYACSGCGGMEQGLKAQELYRKQALVNTERARKVDRATFFNNEFDREMFLGKTFAHHADIQSRDV